jgi:hypothetical protein
VHPFPLFYNAAGGVLSSYYVPLTKAVQLCAAFFLRRQQDQRENGVSIFMSASSLSPHQRSVVSLVKIIFLENMPITPQKRYRRSLIVLVAEQC